MRSGRKPIITATFPEKLEMRLPLRPERTFCPRWSYTSANAELALNGLLRFGTALCTSVLPRGLFSSNTSHFVTRRVTPPRVPASSRPTRSRPRPPRARATRHNAAIERCIKIAPRGPPSRGAAEATHPPAAAAASARPPARRRRRTHAHLSLTRPSRSRRRPSQSHTRQRRAGAARPRPGRRTANLMGSPGDRRSGQLRRRAPG